MAKNKFNKEEIFFIDEQVKSGVKNITKIANSFADKFYAEKDYKLVEKLRKRISRYVTDNNLIKTSVRLEDTKEFKKASQKKLSSGKKYYIITWEQNETPIHTQFYQNILAYKDYLDAELLVILGRYKNPTSVFVDKSHENWSKETEPYHDANRHDIHKYLTILSDVKISPTRKYPLTGLQGLAQGKSIIVGHPKLHLKSEPVLSGYPKKMLFTTGAITLPNYTDSGIGKISDGTHKFGFVIVEIRDEEVFYIRQVEAEESGTFIDLMHKVENGKVNIIDNALGMVCGDTHYGVLDERIDKMNDKISNYFNIKHLVLHDVVDGESTNNHIIKDPIEQFKRYKDNRHLIEEELEKTGDWLEDKLQYNVVIPRANHNDRFDRILREDWRKDVQNSLFYFKYTQAVLEEKAEKGVFAYYLENRFGNRVTTLDYKDSYIIGKYECSQHGDYGANGSKGTPRGFRNLEIPGIYAHTHTPYRADDTLYVGTNTLLSLGYNDRGASSWVQSNVLIADNGIAQHIIFVKGNFTTFSPFLDEKIQD